ncbi:MAG: hypothetical protein RR280_02350 [Bacteroidaceae bacterium]
MYKYLFIFLAFGVCSTLFHSCSNDDEDYSSKMPTFETVAFDKQEIHVGDTVIATIVQKDKGNRIYNGVYLWDCDDAKIINPTLLSQVPRKEPNPTCKLVFLSSGDKTLKFSAKYNGAGKTFSKMQNVTQSGFSVAYTISTLYGSATVTKSRIHVVP